jgi:DNA-binding protein H-NS
MPASLSRIKEQISRLQRQAEAIESQVVDRIRKEIAKYGLTVDQLFGKTTSARGPKAKNSAKPDRPVKFADGTGNTWHGMGKRPDWLRQALESGKTLDDFLVGKTVRKAPAKKVSRKKSSVKAQPAGKAKTSSGTRAATKKKPAAKKTASRKPRAKATQAEAAAS